jgi:hypothetical protein
MARGYLKVTIATKPYLKKYLQKLYGNPLTFSADNHFGICISAFLFRPATPGKSEKHPTGQGDDQKPRETSKANTAFNAPLIYKVHDAPKILRQRVDTFDSFMDIYLPKGILTHKDNEAYVKVKGGFEISDQHTIILNKLFETKFAEELWKMTTIMNILGIETKDALIEICNTYGIVIDDDITFDALKQKEFRYRKKMEISAPDLSSQVVKGNLKRIVLHNSFALKAVAEAS